MYCFNLLKRKSPFIQILSLSNVSSPPFPMSQSHIIEAESFLKMPYQNENVIHL